MQVSMISRSIHRAPSLHVYAFSSQKMSTNRLSKHSSVSRVGKVINCPHVDSWRIRLSERVQVLRETDIKCDLDLFGNQWKHLMKTTFSLKVATPFK